MNRHSATAMLSLTSRNSHSQQGGALVLALVTITILAALLGTMLQSVSNKYWTAFQVASWEEALFAAEGGADVAMVALRKAVQRDATAWTGWTVVKKSGAASSTTPGLVGLATDDNLTYTATLTTHGGEGNSTLSATILIDAPASLKASGQQWYRVRSTGKAPLPGPGRVSVDKLDNLLRRLSLVNDTDYAKQKGISRKAAQPMATRTVECVAKPATLFTQALMSEVQIRNDGAGLIVDSYDSGDAAKSTLGDYDPAKRQTNGDIGSNAFPIKHDKTQTLNLTNDFIFGDVANNYSQIKGVSPSYFDGLDDHPTTNTNPLIKTDGNADPTGNIITNYFRDLPQIKSPGWTTSDRNVGVLDKKDADVVASSSKTTPTRIIANSINLSKDTFVVKLPAGATDGYAEMWVQNDISLKDGGTIQVEPGVHLTVYFEGDIKIEDKKTGAGFDVQSDNPADLVLLGVEQADKTKKKDDVNASDVFTPWKATGNIVLKDADLVAALYAPDHNLVVDVKDAAKRAKTNAGKGRTRLQSGVDIYGAFVARTIQAKGPANFHYDEQLANAGPLNDFGFVSWFEDVNLDRR